MSWTEYDIKKMQEAGKIRGFTMINTTKPNAERKMQNAGRFPQKKVKALQWLDLNLLYWCNERGLELKKENRFCDRGWRFDYAIITPDHKIAIEYHGGIFMQKGGHTNVKGFTRDSDKFNRATVLGWKVITVNAMNYTTVLKTLNEMMK